MPHKIFLSHTYKDKPVVEAVALKLAEIFSKDQVFYDAWSIRPGDGIIERMNEGLEAPEFVFFFVSQNSLSSGMVKLEWQNALYSATNGQMRIIPVRIDGSEMPPLLKQTLFIDMHTVGLEAAIAQIVSVTQGNASFTPQHQGFSNLSFTTTDRAEGGIEVTVVASHLMEPNPNFAVVTSNPESDLEWGMVKDQPFFGGFKANALTLEGGGTAHAITIRPMGATLTPDHPVRLRLKSRSEAVIILHGVFHQKSENEWVPVPEKSTHYFNFKTPNLGLGR